MTSLHYVERGSGPTVIFIHGFPFNQNIWNAFAEKLTPYFQVVTIDLPGFGKSPSLPVDFSLEDVAVIVHTWLKGKRYPRPAIVGHSLGGYVALALAALDIDSMSGMCLFHSTALPDNAEKKESRNKVLEFVEKQGVRAFTSNFTSQLFVNRQHNSITKVKAVAMQSSKEAVVGYIKAMRDRKDRRDLLSGFPKPVLFLAGEKDLGIPPATIQQQVALTRQGEAIILPDVAHMGMFESATACEQSIRNFVSKCMVTS